MRDTAGRHLGRHRARPRDRARASSCRRRQARRRGLHAARDPGSSPPRAVTAAGWPRSGARPPGSSALVGGCRLPASCVAWSEPASRRGRRRRRLRVASVAVVAGCLARRRGRRGGRLARRSRLARRGLGSRLHRRRRTPCPEPAGRPVEPRCRAESLRPPSRRAVRRGARGLGAGFGRLRRRASPARGPRQHRHRRSAVPVAVVDAAASAVSGVAGRGRPPRAGRPRRPACGRLSRRSWLRRRFGTCRCSRSLPRRRLREPRLNRLTIGSRSPPRTSEDTIDSDSGEASARRHHGSVQWHATAVRERSALRSAPAAAGFWATWARSIASSSGGTSLHGSFEPREPDGAAGRACVRLRSPRPCGRRGPGDRRGPGARPGQVEHLGRDRSRPGSG